MQRVLGLLVLALFSSAGVTFAASPSNLWFKSFGYLDGLNESSVSAVAVDGSGNIIVVGYFTGTVNFGGANLVYASGDAFMAKYQPNGAHLWSKKVTSLGAPWTSVQAMTVDGSGRIVITGSFTGTINLGGGALTSAGDYDIFLVQYTSSGVHQWSKRFGSFLDDYGSGVATDASDNVLLACAIVGPLSLGGSNVGTGFSEMGIAKYNSSGAHVWSRSSTGITNPFTFSGGIGADASGNVLANGNFYGSMNFGGSTLTSAGGGDVYVAKYSSAGVHVWSQRFGGTGNESGWAITVDGAGNSAITGGFNNSVDFGGGALVSAGGSDVYVARYNAAGVHQWSKRFGSTSSDTGKSVDMDASGNVVVGGEFTGTINLGGVDFVSAGLNDVFLAEIDPAGIPLWGYSIGSPAGEIFSAVAADDSGNALVVGKLVLPGIVGGSGYAGGFVGKFGGGSPQPSILSIADVKNDQGRQVRLSFHRSGVDDADAGAPVTAYAAYRRVAALPAATAKSGVEAAPGAITVPGYDFVGTVPAFGEDSYNIIVATLADSTIALGPYYSSYFVRAITASPSTFFDSPPDSGYSLDNLAPGAPQNFVYDAGGLEWDESSAADFDFFTVYGSNTDSFGAATLVDYSVAAAMDVTASPYVYYYVTATDFSGNEGKPAKVNTLSGVGGTPKSYVLSVSNYPNPFNPRTTVSYTVPSRGRVTVSIYDTRGALVATLFDGERAAGAYSVEWDGRADDAAVAASGIYFARIEHASGTRSKKMVLLK